MGVNTEGLPKNEIQIHTENKFALHNSGKDVIKW